MMASVGEQQHEVSSNSSTVLSTSVTARRGEGARVQKKRKGAHVTAETEKRRQDRSATWSNVETEKLLQTYTQISQDKGRFRRTSACDESFWVAVSQKVQGRADHECQGRMDTLTKSWRKIKARKFAQLDEEILRGMKLPTAMTVDWYDQMCKIKEKPDNARVVSTETGLVQEGDQSNATSLELTHELAAPMPHQQDSIPDFMTLRPREAPSYRSSAGEDEQLHQILCPGAAAPVQALVPGAQDVAVPPPPRSPKPHQDAFSTPQPAVDAASSDLIPLYDSATAAVGSVPCLDDVVIDGRRADTGWIVVDTSSLPPTESNDAPIVEDLVDFDDQDIDLGAFSDTL